MADQRTILIVDDEELVRASLIAELQGCNFELTTAANGEMAIALLQKRHFDLVLTDLMMEGLDGIQVLKAAKELDPEIVVVILTGYGHMASAIDALRLGANDYMVKPCDIDELLMRMQRCFTVQELRKKVKLYEEILPVCCLCKKIRDDRERPGHQSWLPADTYLTRKTNIKISHGYCPECFELTMNQFKSSVAAPGK